MGYIDATFEARTNTLFIFLEYVPGGFGARATGTPARQACGRRAVACWSSPSPLLPPIVCAQASAPLSLVLRRTARACREACARALLRPYTPPSPLTPTPLTPTPLDPHSPQAAASRAWSAALGALGRTSRASTPASCCWAWSTCTAARSCTGGWPPLLGGGVRGAAWGAPSHKGARRQLLLGLEYRTAAERRTGRRMGGRGGSPHESGGSTSWCRCLGDAPIHELFARLRPLVTKPPQ